MKTQKMSLANIQGKLSRTEMKNIMAGCVTEEDEVEGSAVCISCSGDGGCRPNQVCRSSPSCPSHQLVCARGYFC